MSESPELSLRFFNRHSDDSVYVRVDDLLASLRAQADRLEPEYDLQAQVMRNVCSALEMDAKFAGIVTEPKPPPPPPEEAEDPASAARGCLAGLGLTFLALVILAGCVTLGRLVF